MEILFKRRNLRCVSKLKFSEDLSILMNGPSLPDDLKQLPTTDSADVLVCNHFCDTELFIEIRPNLYLIQDHYFWSHDVIGFFKSKANRSLANLIRRVDWDMNLILPLSAWNTNFVQQVSKNSFIKVWFYRDQYMPIRFGSNPKLCRFNFLYCLCIKSGLAFVPPMNVLPTAIMLGFLNASSRIFFYGVSFDWWKAFRVEADQLITETEYCYGTERRIIYNDKKGVFPGTLSFKLMNFALTYQLLEAISCLLKESGVELIDVGGKACIQMNKGESDAS
ncbi:hypothetical protein OAE57_01070 [Synechococcus sp. AH-551-C10]|nr:hypothetical protein [Synechococcus sp. AH-551-C10]MDB4659644.1 hypothetical protein [Synechococcus sp. AH-551-C10]